MALRLEKAPHTPEARIVRAVTAGVFANTLSNTSLWLALFQDSHEDSLAGWLAEKTSGVVDFLSERLMRLPRLRLK